ncbi:MAG: nicotinate-nicotinamide nucleotide adenylyltransferase, partial [Candidatus Electrothrix sp. GM3_4]|nr:nicotinate-nicotinamide nucleotide adenylyltransferase [Candidatus Electrothrix sp. GM3_4]
MGDTSKKKRIGLFGGTFDPVHNGHMAIARQAAEEARLDQVLFIPAADPPHKKTPGASYWHRVALLETALSGSSVAQDRFAISLLEAELPSCKMKVTPTLARVTF